jgi:peroxiredoxin
MPAIKIGALAPDVSLPSSNGQKFSLRDTLNGGVAVVLAFFKVSCPTCQYAFPFLQRLHAAYSNGKVRVVGVSQDDQTATQNFNRQYNVTFPTLLDDAKRYVASNSYGLINVPSIFLITPDGAVEQTIIGWEKSEFESLNHRLAQICGVPGLKLFKAGENVLEFKAG